MSIRDHFPPLGKRPAPPERPDDAESDESDAVEPDNVDPDDAEHDESDAVEDDAEPDDAEPVDEPGGASTSTKREPGVRYMKGAKKPWYGKVTDKLKGVEVCTEHFYATEREATVAVRALCAKLDAKFEEYVAPLIAADPLVRDLPRAPKPSEAAKGVRYCNLNYKDNYKPYAAVLCGGKFQVACQTAECTRMACKDASGAIKFCKTHMVERPASLCAHGRRKSECRECNPNILNTVHACSSCGNRLSRKRKTTKNGNGLCLPCETNAQARAAASGSAPPPKGKKTEDVVLDKLIPMVVYTNSTHRITPDSRDSMSNMLGSNSNRRRRECDTTKQRRPDLLYVVRSPGEIPYIVAVLKVEVDEHSHTSYETACECGKIDDEFQSIQQIAVHQGAAKGSAGRHDAKMVFVKVIKFNPDALDVKPRVPLDERIAELAKRCNDFLNTPAEVFERLSADGRANRPHVLCMYYHSKEGGPHLEHFETKCCEAWHYEGNFVG